MGLRGAIARQLLGLPGGRRLLQAIRVAYRGGRDLRGFFRRPRVGSPVAAPWQDHDWTVLTTEPPAGQPFLNSNRVAAACRYVYKQDGSFHVNEDGVDDWYFCKTDDVHAFFAGHAPEHEFVLFTGHSDYPVDRRHRRYLTRPELTAWFATNPLVRHRKLRARALGITGLATVEVAAAIREVQHRRPPKRQLFHATYRVEHNPFERAYCLEQTGVPLGRPVPWLEYLDELASSYFCISPHGIGIDCVRTWESLLLGTIPVVRRSLVTEHHRDYPMIVLDDWAQFRSIDFSPEFYERTWANWDPDELLFARYRARVERFLAEV